MDEKNILSYSGGLRAHHSFMQTSLALLCLSFIE